MPILWKVFDFFANNKTAQWVLGILTLAGLYKAYERLRDNRIRNQVEQKIEVRAQETATKVIEDAQEKTNDVIEKADEARAAVSGGTPSGELPKSTQSTLFRD